ncbi:MAG: hypothetical protein ACK4MV_14120 [Beijerinckiaceae bacterium]
MTINTRRLRASLPAVSGGQRDARQRGSDRPYVVWLLVALPVAMIFAIHFFSDFLAKG